MKKLGALLGLVALLTAYSVAPRPAQSAFIVGKWKESGSTATYEFRTDGTVHLAHQSMTIPGTYRWLDGERLRMDFGNPKIMVGGTVHAKVTSQQMTMISPKGERITFEKVD